MSNTTALSFESEYHQFLYVGIDVHKDTHTAVATNCFGQHLLELRITNSEKDFDHLVNTVQRLSIEKHLSPIFGLEDSYGYGLRLARYLASRKFPVKMVSPVLVDRARKIRNAPREIRFFGCARGSKSLDPED